MKTTQNVLNLVSEYQADPNCWPDLWINDCLSKGEVTLHERDQFLQVLQEAEWANQNADDLRLYELERKG